MFKNAMKETSNLFDNKTVRPIGGILMLLKREQDAEFVRECFSELSAELPKNKGLIRLHTKRFEKEARQFDDELHIWVYDIIYCFHVYGFYRNADVCNSSAKGRSKVVKQQAERDELVLQISEKEEQLRALKEGAVESPGLAGGMVTHKLIGTGKVTACIGNMLTVGFSTRQKSLLIPPRFPKVFWNMQTEKFSV